MRRLHGFGIACALGWALYGCSAADPPAPAPAPPPAARPDDDGDTIANEDEGWAQRTDTDGDGTPDFQDPDSDGDGIEDQVEAGDADLETPTPDSDGDHVPDFRDTDSDENGRPDGVDGAEDTDGDGALDFADNDDDGDGIFDVKEFGDPESPIDTDQDDTPDFRDIDSDNDTIRDLDEGWIDPDHDTIPAFRDPDADGDCVPDWAEAGDVDLATPARDVDMDGGADYLDIDSDNDGLLDGLEDKNCNGSVDPGESLPSDADSDGDGVTDLVEVAANTDPLDGADNPQASGDFVFVVPYHKTPTPAEDTLDFSTDIVQADVFFLMDTTGSMNGEISALQSSLNSIITQLAASIPNFAAGVGEFADYPTTPYGDGSLGDQPFILNHRIMSVSTPAGIASVQARVNALQTHSGGDLPEANWEGLFQAATGVGVTAGGAFVPAFDPLTAYPSAPPPGEVVGDIGGVGFRPGSLPIAVVMTDAHGHNSEDFWADAYSFAGAAKRSTAIDALNDIGVRVIGVVSNDEDYTSAKADLTSAVTATGAVVPPAAWGLPGIDRPPTCPVSQCCTGQSDSGQPTDPSGMCPLTFTINASGFGLGASIVKAIRVLTTYTKLDIRATIADDPSDAVDAVQTFVHEIRANPNAPAPCTQGLEAIDSDGDFILDTFPEVSPGPTVCFDVIPKQNNTYPPSTTPQVFRAVIDVIGDNVTTLDTRDVYFLVPPEIPDPTPN